MSQNLLATATDAAKEVAGKAVTNVVRQLDYPEAIRMFENYAALPSSAGAKFWCLCVEIAELRMAESNMALTENMAPLDVYELRPNGPQLSDVMDFGL